MTVKTFEITIREGVKMQVLLTPALYGVASRKGIDLDSDLKSGDVTGMTRAYAKLAYCAALNKWEVDRIDNPSVGDFPYTFSDFDTWSWENQAELLAFMDAVLMAFTGKSVKDYQGEDVKKKKNRGLR